MRPRRLTAPLLAWAMLALCGHAGHAAPPGTSRPAYPPAHTVPVSDDYFGTLVRDPYRWLEDAADPNVQAWTAAENALTRQLLDRWAPQRAALTARLEELFRAPTDSCPVVRGTRSFFFRRAGLQDHAVLLVREGSLTAAPRVLLDANQFSPDGTAALDWWVPSPDGRLIAYGRSAGGSEKSTLYVRDVRTARDLPDEIPHTHFGTLVWDGDGRGFTYTRYPEPGTVPAGDENYYRRVYAHRLGADWRTDPLVWGAAQDKEHMPILYSSTDQRWQFLQLPYGWSRNELYVRRTGEAEFRPLARGHDARFDGDALGNYLFIRTDYGAPRFRLLVTTADEADPERWREVLPEQPGILAGFLVADGHLIVHLREQVISRLFVHEPGGRRLAEIKLPAPGSVTALSGRPDSPELFFGFESFAFPPVVYRYDLRSGQLDVHTRLDIDLDPNDYETRQLWATSRDGTRVPLFVVHRRGLARNGRHPTVLRGYGGFATGQYPEFRREVLPWLEQGGVWAVANTRGGDEFGRPWHLAAQREHKQNAFDDFAACAAQLVAEGYTTSARLGARGASNGGLLMGALLVQHPELFRALHADVPLTDMLRYPRFEIARIWIPEFGSAEKAADFPFLYAYSPYHHVQTGTAYPAVLLTAAERDSRVAPLHARKLAAALQAATSSDRPVLLWVEPHTGHGAGKPLRKALAALVDEWTFFAWQLGLWEQR
jgi:prolyl oligopeptidase